jgi:hypothetical protein
MEGLLVELIVVLWQTRPALKERPNGAKRVQHIFKEMLALRGTRVVDKDMLLCVYIF